jgi:hypothetical protein
MDHKSIYKGLVKGFVLEGGIQLIECRCGSRVQPERFKAHLTTKLHKKRDNLALENKVYITHFFRPVPKNLY